MRFDNKLFGRNGATDAVVLQPVVRKRPQALAAMEVLKLGRGGTNYISRLLGIDKGSLIQGKKELTRVREYQQIPFGKQRRVGGGRKKRQHILTLKAY